MPLNSFNIIIKWYVIKTNLHNVWEKKNNLIIKFINHLPCNFITPLMLPVLYACNLIFLPCSSFAIFSWNSHSKIRLIIIMEWLRDILHASSRNNFARNALYYIIRDREHEGHIWFARHLYGAKLNITR